MTGRRLPALLVAIAIAAWTLEAAVDLYPHQHLTDLPVYEAAAREMADGGVPYRDFAFEYPPLAAGLLLFARALPVSYAAAFHVLMLAALCATVLATVATARALGFGPGRQAAAGTVVALIPLLLGDFVATRFDLAVAALLAWTLWAAVTERFRLAWGLLAGAVALKLAPVILVPLLVLWHRRQAGFRPALGGAGTAAAGVAAVFVPFVALSPSGVWDLFDYHLSRPLQIESLGASYLLGLHELAGVDLMVETSFGSQNLAGTGPQVVAALTTAVAVAAIVAICVTVVLGLRRKEPPADAGLLVAGFAATLAAAVAAGKVLSPQFVVWLVPATLLVAGRYGRAAVVVTAAVFVTTQAYFPVHYWDLVALDTAPIVTLIVRNALAVALLALVWPRPASARRRVTGTDAQRRTVHGGEQSYVTDPPRPEARGSAQASPTGTLNVAIDLARPSGEASTTAPWTITSPAEGSNRPGRPERNLRSTISDLTPITPSWGPVMPTSVT